MIAFIMAGGVGKRLSLLTSYRAKPAVPFAGRYRIIDFTLTNCVRSGISNVYVLTQYISRSLIGHLGIGKPWDLDRIKGGLHILHPHLGYQAADWYRGTADAIFQNIPVIKNISSRHILILSGDHVYHMDYRKFLDFHLHSRTPVTIAVVDVPPSWCKEFGIATLDSKGKILNFEEKPLRSKSSLASMGIYIFDKDYLISILRELKPRHDDLDFGKHVIPHLVDRGMVSAYRFGGFWLDIGTLKSYYRASLSLLTERSKLKLSGGHTVLTVPDDNPPLLISPGARVKHSLICKGCMVEGEVESSVISPGVIIEKGARVENSILLHDCKIRRGASVRNSIIDKLSDIGAGARIGWGDPRILNRLQPEYLDFGLTVIGRTSDIPAGIEIGTNCLYSGSMKRDCHPAGNLEDGESYLCDEANILS
ncbi:MAG: glucose-1-phosphate adenylyltransferase [Candidatus Krumholzibacteriota bacterium]|nr:glucose-1-phosphate adenylyltransferase [Candidatus Krumholzibacteriota bacterium]